MQNVVPVRLFRTAVFTASLVALAMLFPHPAAAAVDPYEPDNLQVQAAYITTDGVEQEHQYEGSSVGSSGVDWVYFDAKPGKSYRIKIRRASYTWYAVNTTAFAPGGIELPLEAGSATENMLFYADAEMPVYLKMNQPTWGAYGSYYVSVLEGDATSLALADAFEPDNSIRSARDLPVDGTVQRHATDIAADFMRIRVRKGKTYRLATSWEGSPGYVIASVVTTSGTEVLGRELLSREASSRYLVPAEDATLYVRCDDGYVSGTFLLSVTELETSTIKGTVTSAVTGDAISGARVSVVACDRTGFHASPPVAVMTTAADGTWSVTLPPGYYTALFEDPMGLLLGEYYGGVIPPSYEGAPIHVTEESTSTADGRLWAVSGIKASVVQTDGAPVEGSTVTLWSGWSAIASAVSDASGTCTFGGLDPRGAYRVSASPIGGLISDAPVAVPLTTGQTAAATLTLARSGGISGTVTDGSRGRPLGGTVVNVWSMSGPRLGQTTVTGDDGSYTLTGLATGGYRVSFTDPAGINGPYGREWRGSSLYGWEDPVSVTISQVTTGIDKTFYDRQPPVTTTSVSSAWQRGPVEIAFSAADQGWMGATTMFVAPGASDPETYSAPFSYNDEGVHEFDFWSADDVAVDGTRNIEATQTLVVRIDNTPPVTSAGDGLSGAVLRAPAVIDLRALDELSGVKLTRWNVAEKEGSGEIVRLSSPGEYTLEYASTDFAGNVEATRSVSFAVAAKSGSVSSVTASTPHDAVAYRLDSGWPLSGGPGLNAWSQKPEALAFDTERRILYTADPVYDGISSFQWDGTPSLRIPTSYSWFEPTGLGVDGEGRLYSGCYNGVHAWGRDGSNLWFVNHSGWDKALDVAQDGTLWYANERADTIRRIRSGKDVGYFFLGFVPVDITIARSGEVFVLGADARVHVLSTDGVPVSDWPLPERSYGIEADTDGYVYVTLASGVAKYTGRGGLIEQFAAPAPRSIASDAEGNVYVVNSNNPSVARYIHGLRSTTVTFTSGPRVALGMASFVGNVAPGLPGLNVRVQSSPDGISWSDVASGTTGSGGTFSLSTTSTAGVSYRVAAAGDATFGGSITATATPLPAGTLGIVSSATTVDYGKTVNLTATLRSPANALMPTTMVIFESDAGKGWTPIGSAKTDTQGVAVFSALPTIRARYRARYAGSTSMAWCTSAEKIVAVRAAVGAPVTPSLVREGDGFLAYGSLNPHHTDGARSVTLHFEQYVAQRWVPTYSCAAVNRDYRSGTRYERFLHLPKGRWRVRARHSDAGHADSYSSYRAIRVY